MGEESEKKEEMDVEEVSESTIGSAMQSISPTIVNNTSNTAKEESSTQRIKCGRCMMPICRDDFPRKSEVLKSSKIKRICIDCSHPACTNPSCKTCKVCRDTSCKKKRCNKKPRALLGKAAQYLGRAAQYECDACLFPKCACGKEMSSTTRIKKRNDPEWISAMTPRTWSCECCPARKRQKSL